MNIRLCLSLCVAAFAALAVEPSAVLFENDSVKVIRALEKAHVKGRFHEHKPNRVMVYMGAGKQRFEFQDGRAAKVFDWKPGQVEWSPAEGMHAPEVISDEPFNILEVELKKPGAATKAAIGPRDAVKVDAKHHKVELDNSQVRVLRVRLEPHAATAMIEHKHNAVLLFLTDQEARITTSTGAVQNSKHKAGEAEWATPGTMKMENTGSGPLEMVVVEITE